MLKSLLKSTGEMKYAVSLSLLVFLSILGCQSNKLPSKRYLQYDFQITRSYEGDELRVALKNPLHSPLRIWIQNSDTKLQAQFDELNPVVLEAKSDTILSFSDVEIFNGKINYTSLLGSTAKVIQPIKMGLPFPDNRQYRIIQGNNHDYSHNTDWSRFALDFQLKVNDTINAATDGFVVGLIDEYKDGGKGDKWRPFANFITIYEPESGLFTQYVHLVHKGSLVKLGDQVKRGQPIALSGMTGKTDIAHLHFSCLVPVDTSDGLKSVPHEFIEGYKSEDLKRNDIVIK